MKKTTDKKIHIHDNSLGVRPEHCEKCINQKYSQEAYIGGAYLRIGTPQKQKTDSWEKEARKQIDTVVWEHHETYHTGEDKVIITRQFENGILSIIRRLLANQKQEIGLEFWKWFYSSDNDGEMIEDAIERITGVTEQREKLKDL